MGNEDNRAAILRTAEDLFLSRRFDQVTLDEVSKKARVGKGTIYRYFRSKEDLYERIFLAALNDFAGSLEQMSAASESSDKKLYQTARLVVAFDRRHRSLFRALHSEDSRRSLKRPRLHGELHKRRRAIVKHIAGVIRDGQHSGDLRSDIEPADAAGMLLALTREAPRRAMSCGSRSIPVKKVIGLFLNGIRRQ